MIGKCKGSTNPDMEATNNNIPMKTKIKLGHPHQLNSQNTWYVDVNSMDPMNNNDIVLQNTLTVLHKHKPMVSSTLLMGLGKKR